jgi:hypothetical protein
MPAYQKSEVEAAIYNDEAEELVKMVIHVSMNPDIEGWAESVCLRLSNHKDSNVRGNALLGFGHIARVIGKLESPNIRSIVSNALVEESEYVRGQAHSAAEDLQHFMGMQIEGYE